MCVHARGMDNFYQPFVCLEKFCVDVSILARHFSNSRRRKDMRVSGKDIARSPPNIARCEKNIAQRKKDIAFFGKRYCAGEKRILRARKKRWHFCYLRIALLEKRYGIFLKRDGIF
jgi:hypothetical protein